MATRGGVNTLRTHQVPARDFRGCWTTASGGRPWSSSPRSSASGPRTREVARHHPARHRSEPQRAGLSVVRLVAQSGRPDPVRPGRSVSRRRCGRCARHLRPLQRRPAGPAEAPAGDPADRELHRPAGRLVRARGTPGLARL